MRADERTSSSKTQLHTSRTQRRERFRTSGARRVLRRRARSRYAFSRNYRPRTQGASTSVTHTFSITGNGIPAGAQVVGFRGREAISRPYRVEVFVLVPEAALQGFDPRALLGARATLKVHRANGDVRRVVHGAWSTVSLVRSVAGGAALFRCALAPMLWRLSLTRRSRVFVRETLLQTTERLLREAGLTEQDFTFEVASRDRYTPREHVCQYHESNLDFLSRHLEHEGFYYYFAHANDGSRERLVITDSVTFARPYDSAAVRFLATDTAGSATEGVRSLGCEYSAVATGARAYGYNPITPGVRVYGESLDGSAGGVLSSWEPARDATEGTRYARIRAEESRAAQSVIEAQGRVFTACAGYLATLDDHPILSGEHLVTEANFVGSNYSAHRELATALGLGTEVFETTFKAIPGRVQYRPPRVTERPRVHGFELGLVKGPTESAYAQVDEHGRYLVDLMFDDDKTKATPSARLRMLQPHGGPGGMGFHFPLRNGTEVLVSFLGGDPDAPVIAGVAPNAEKVSPVTSSNTTKNVLQTGGGTRLEIEDTQGSEAVDWATPYKNTKFHMGKQPGANPYEIVHASEGSGHVTVGQNWDEDVGGNRTEFVRGRVWEHYGPNPPSRQSAAASSAVHHTTVAGAQTTVVEGIANEDYKSHHVSTVFGNRKVGVLQDDDHTVEGSLTQAVKGDVTQTIGGKWTVVAADKEHKIASERKENVGAEHSVTLGAQFELYAGAQVAINGGEQFSVNLGAMQDINVALKGEANLLGKAELTTGVVLGVLLGAEIGFSLGPKVDIAISPSYELQVGLAASMHIGVKAEKEDLSVEWGSAAAWQKGLAIFL